MKLKYYGTAAAEGVPGLFCECETCQKSRKYGGRNFRSRSQALVNGKLLIDFPPDTLYHVFNFGLELHKIQNMIITHKHPDHLRTSDFFNLAKTYAYPDDRKPLHIYGTQPTIDDIAYMLQKNNMISQGRWILHEVIPYEKYEIDGMTVIPYCANHDFSVSPVIYDISDGDKRMLYGNDTGWFTDKTWEYIENNKPKFDFVSLDCTCGVKPDCGCHMNLELCVKTADKLRELGCADKDTVFYLHHFSHNDGVTYDELVPIAEEQGFGVSYDGLEVEF